MTTDLGVHAIGLLSFIPLKKATYSWSSYVLKVINCHFKGACIRIPVNFSRSDYLDILETHQGTC